MFNQGGVARTLLFELQSLGAENGGNFLNCLIKMLVEDNIIEFMEVAHLLARRRQTLRDDLFGILATVAHAHFQGLFGRRQDKDAFRFGDALTDLPGAILQRRGMRLRSRRRTP